MMENLAGAFSKHFFLAMRLPKNEFIGTAAWLCLLSCFKLPFHVSFLGHTITPEKPYSFKSKKLVSAIVVGHIVGVALVKNNKR